MNLPNKITMGRIVLSIMLLILLVFPFSLCGIDFPKYELFGTISVDLKYIIGGVIFLIASLTDFIDGNIARKRNLVTDFGKVMDAIADKVLVNGVLIVLAVEGYISVVVPVVIVSRDIFVDSIKMVAGQKSGAVGASKAGKFKTAFMLVGITLLFFQDIPFSLLGVNFVSRTIIMIATVLSVISGIQYYVKNKKYLFDTK